MPSMPSSSRMRARYSRVPRSCARAWSRAADARARRPVPARRGSRPCATRRSDSLRLVEKSLRIPRRQRIQRAAREQAHGDRVHRPAAMEKRRAADETRAGRQPLAARDVRRRLQIRAIGEHRALRQRRRARRVLNAQQVVGAGGHAGRQRTALADHRPCRRAIIRRVEDDRAVVERVERRHGLVEIVAPAVLRDGDQRAGAHIAQDDPQFGGSQARVDRHRHRAQRIHREEGRQPIERIVEPERDAIAGRHIRAEELHRSSTRRASCRNVSSRPSRRSAVVSAKCAASWRSRPARFIVRAGPAYSSAGICTAPYAGFGTNGYGTFAPPGSGSTPIAKPAVEIASF